MTPFHLRQRLARLLASDHPGDQAAAYCRRLVRKSRSNFSYAFVFLPLDQKDALEAVYAFCRVIDDAADEAGDAAALAAWERELGRAFGHGDGPPATPVGAQLAAAARRFPIREADLAHVLDGVKSDLVVARYPTWADLRVYCEKVASAVGLVCIEIFGHATPTTRAYATELGVAMQLTNILRDVSRDARIGRIYLPGEDLARFGVAEDDVLERRCTPAVRALMQFEAERAHELYQRARGRLDDLDRERLFVAEIMADIYEALLGEIMARAHEIMAVAPELRRRRKIALAMRRWYETHHHPHAA